MNAHRHRRKESQCFAEDLPDEGQLLQNVVGELAAAAVAAAGGQSSLHLLPGLGLKLRVVRQADQTEGESVGRGCKETSQHNAQTNIDTLRHSSGGGENIRVVDFYVSIQAIEAASGADAMRAGS